MRLFGLFFLTSYFICLTIATDMQAMVVRTPITKLTANQGRARQLRNHAIKIALTVVTPIWESKGAEVASTKPDTVERQQHRAAITAMVDVFMLVRTSGLWGGA
jgi:hypothetical protein